LHKYQILSKKFDQDQLENEKFEKLLRFIVNNKDFGKFNENNVDDIKTVSTRGKKFTFFLTIQKVSQI
jgi:hypothetical protein